MERKLADKPYLDDVFPLLFFREMKDFIALEHNKVKNANCVEGQRRNQVSADAYN